MFKIEVFTNMKNKLLAITTLLLVIVSVAYPISNVHAQTAPAGNATQWWNPDLNTFNSKVFPPGSANDTDIFGERYTFAQVNWIVNSLALLQAGSMSQCFSAGANTSQCVSNIQAEAPLSSPVLFLAGAADSFLSHKPASGIDYVAQKIRQYSPVQDAYAQEGTGFGALQPLQRLWVAFRNVAFGLMSFVIIILAFMIMLRQKIAPQVVVSVQSALPKVAIALIFITFSYAIAGLIIDLAYVVMGLSSAIVAQSGLFKGGAPNVIDIFNKLNNPIAAFTGWTIILGGFIFGAGATAVIGTIATGGLATIVGAVAGLIGVILLGLGLVAIFRIFVTMLKAFTMIVFLVIGAPIIGLLGVVSIGPGIGGWIRQMVAQLSVFVAICLTMLLAHMVFWTMTIDLNGWLGDILTGGANYFNFATNQVNGSAILLPGFGGFPIQILAFFIGFGIIFSAPKIASGVRDQIASGRGSYGADTFGTMLGAGIVGGAIGGQIKDVRKELTNNVLGRVQTFGSRRQEEWQQAKAAKRTEDTLRQAQNTTGALNQQIKPSGQSKKQGL